MTSEQRDCLRRRVPLLPYLEQQGWKPTAYSGRDEVCGRCPLHGDRRPSFYVNRRKNVFYCHGCGRGGDVIRLVELLHGLDFRSALATLLTPLGEPEEDRGNRLWRDACDFYRHRLSVDLEAQSYLRSRGIEDPAVVGEMGIGYAPGGCLRAYLEDRGYSRASMASSGFINGLGRDRLWRAICFPIAETRSMYGRHMDPAGGRHRFLARPKGGLWGWSRARSCQTAIVVEGLFDLASLWQAGFRNAVALLGSHFNARQQAQLCDGRERSVYLCLDADENGSGPRAARLWSQRLGPGGVRLLPVQLPQGYDPNRFFAEGGSAAEFSDYLEQAGR
ncbi:MAG: CHC2 zinc finger domain-containing protein [Bryobacteraceae bacterium]